MNLINNNLLQLLLFFTLPLRTITIVHRSLFSFHTQHVFIQDWLNTFWIASRLQIRLNSSWTPRFVLTHNWLNSNWISIVDFHLISYLFALKFIFYMCNYNYILKKYLSYPYIILWLGLSARIIKLQHARDNQLLSNLYYIP